MEIKREKQLVKALETELKEAKIKEQQVRVTRTAQGGPLSRYVLTCVSENSQKRVPFSKRGSDLSRSEKRVSFLLDLGNKGILFISLFIVWIYFHFSLQIILPATVIQNHSNCYSEIRVQF